MKQEIKIVSDQEKLNAIFQCLELLELGHITRQGKRHTVFAGRRYAFTSTGDRELVKIEDLEED